MSNAKSTVLSAAGELFGRQDPSAVDRWVAADYRQHSALAADGPEALRRLVSGLPEGFRYEGARVIADGDLVALHGTYHGFGPEPLGGVAGGAGGAARRHAPAPGGPAPPGGPPPP
ncbi:nuclear transport factor 2 family protein, partial [Streptomyces sp. NPDC059456]|uniref:nuclear transport factor 2 family protein n=1 Tax=Streptomyces sp. NPDC059456 TaxID=3346838 RepID=UPI0036C8C242